MRIEPLGERAVRIEVPAALDRRAMLDALVSMPGVLDAHASESHVCVLFEGAPPELDDLASRIAHVAPRTTREHVIDVIYDGEDLEEIASLARLDRDEVIERHARVVYEVSFVGFLPGFAYLRGLDPALAAIPRRDSPRPRVPAGALALAGGFTGVYPWSSPGGWRLVGRAPCFAPLDGDHVRLAIGDRVRFERVG
ncbi:5-oxoprolinase subunit B family protein [Sandaracinus amylolyticus]|uniref:Allophanate hydrolase 2 subunit 1 n=1 Tax=Sandaracinus amylolyticus TaxID=927083 RepID=A0A0F6W5U1_9BACT|nr:carboxyltransferase domain-containing protein [Sandaracinus amylolyticus]AKF08180.1 Allophanate hydrolase 2 subunit 1 [Sandaracinus amylolyticus]